MKNSNGAVYPQHSNTRSATTPQGENAQVDLQELKRNVGILPFAQRIKIDSKGFSKCPFHSGDSDTSFHVEVKEDGVCLGTCFSDCGQSFDAIAFVAKYDNVRTGIAIRTLIDNGNKPFAVPVLRKKDPAIPMTVEKWSTAGRAVTDADVAKLAASRPNSDTPSAETLNKTGFRIADKGTNVFLVAPYRLDDHFYTLKARNLETKEFFQENSVSQKGLFNVDAVTEGCDVFIVESELDAAVLHEIGEIAVSVINASQKQIEHEVLKKLTTAGRIFLVGDQDSAGQTCMDNVSHLLPAAKVYRITFDGSKDIGELAQAAKKDAPFVTFKETFEALKVDALASWVTKNIPYISALSDEPLQWTVDRLLPFGGLLLISGKYGSMKSLIALFMVSGIENGTFVFGRKVLKKIPVLYIDRENPQQVVAERRTHIGVLKDTVRYWGDWNEIETPSLDDPRLKEFAMREQGVIVFDSLADWLDGANENDPSEMTEVMHKFRRLARLGAGVIVLHHADKYRSGYRGSTAIPAGTDMAVKIAKRDDDVTIEMRVEKFRACGAWELDIKFDFHGEYTCQVLRDQKPGERVKQENASDTGTVLMVVEQNPGVNQKEAVALLKAHGIGRDRAAALLARCVTEGLLRPEVGERGAVQYHLKTQ